MALGTIKLSFPKGKLQWSAVTSPHRPETSMCIPRTRLSLIPWAAPHTSHPGLLLGSLQNPLRCLFAGEMQCLQLRASVSSQRSSCGEHQSCVRASVPPSGMLTCGRFGPDRCAGPGPREWATSQVHGNELYGRATTDPAGTGALERQHVLVWVKAALVQQPSAFQKKRESKAPPAKRLQRAKGSDGHEDRGRREWTCR